MNELPGLSQGGARPLSGTRPLWRSKTLLLALVATSGGLFLWWKNTSAGATPLESSAAFRFGGSFVAGFIIGWAFRMSLRLAFVAVAVLLMALFFVKWTGWVHLDWDLLERAFRESLEFVKGEAMAAKKFLTGWLPSGVAGFLGIWRGMRHR